MLKQVFTKLFSTDSLKPSSSNQNIKTYQHRPPIYNPVPTISSCFQQQSSIADSLLTNYYNSTDLNRNNQSTSQIPESKSFSVSSKSISSSSSSQESSNNTSKNFNLTSPPSSNLKNSHQIYIAPHCIKYTNSTLDDTIYRIDDDSLNEIATEILESDNSPPKLQIVFYENKYFAINNSHLQIYKQMQYVGLITHVQADVISVETIPLPLRKHLLQTPSNLASSNSDECDEDDDEDESIINGNNESFQSSKQSRCSKLNGIGSSSSSTSSGIISDIITQANVDRISKSMLVDETYEFGLSENCVESEKEEEEEDEDEDENDDGDDENYDEDDDVEEDEVSNEGECDNEENLPSFEKVRTINRLIAQKLLEETSKNNRVNNILSINENENHRSLFKDVNEVFTSDDLIKDNEWNEYQKFIASSNRFESTKASNPTKSQVFGRRRQSKDLDRNGTSKAFDDDSKNELKNLLSQDE